MVLHIFIYNEKINFVKNLKIHVLVQTFGMGITCPSHTHEKIDTLRILTPKLINHLYTRKSRTGTLGILILRTNKSLTYGRKGGKTLKLLFSIKIF